MLGLLAPLLQKQGVNPNVLLAMKGNNGFGGEGGWFMWVIFLFFLMGWGGNGWGGFGNNGRGGLANEINNDNGRALSKMPVISCSKVSPTKVSPIPT